MITCANSECKIQRFHPKCLSLLDNEVPGKLGIYDKLNEKISQVRRVQVSEINGFIFNAL